MNLNVDKELASLRRMSVGQLRVRYAEVFGEATRSRHKQWLIKRILWRMQALAEGDLSERARRRAVELANDADLRLRDGPHAYLAEPHQAVSLLRVQRGPEAWAGDLSDRVAPRGPDRAVRGRADQGHRPRSRADGGDGPAAPGPGVASNSARKSTRPPGHLPAACPALRG